ncbi:MAG: hypothetical protein Q7W45_07195 [Bacteroidota bacterium]|nr:hypothetical protein [Bacteroidota bacterium]MDP3143926.1 hypothetical protein [Bacteroidota bacterium]
MQNSENILIQKLDEFIRRYYKNQLVKGILYSSGILLAAFLSVVFLEFFGEFNSIVRGILFFSFLSSTLFVLAKYIAVPLLKLNKIGKVISYNQAASIIGNHFTNVQDKLLNVLQLQSNQILSGSSELLVAGINQKINELKPIPFTTAVNINENKKYLKYVVPLLLLTTAVFIIWPQIITKSTQRLVNYQTYYEKEMPFNFTIQNKNLQALQTQDYNLEVKITGSQLPNEVFININGIEYKLEKENNNTFKYTFANLQSTTIFQLDAAGFTSKEYELKVLPKPTLMQFNLQLIYPSYLNKPSENITNTGDLQIPQGTKVNWVFNTKNTNELKIKFSDSLAFPKRNNENQFQFSRKFLQSNNYTVKALNEFVLTAADSVNYSINVIPDQYPVIDVNEKLDSLDPKNIYFSGQIKDDYGFSHLAFHYKKFGTDTTGKTFEANGTYPILVNKTQVSQPYFYFLDASQFNLQPGDKIEYYFEVFDNDGVNGNKSAKTQLMVFKAPTKEEINENTERNNSEIKKDLEESIKKAKQLQKDVNELSKKINDKKQLGYEEKKKLEEMIKKQQELQNKIEDIKKENELNNKQQNEFSKTDESIMEKQKQLEELFENVMTPEMKKLFDELNKMLEKLDKNEVQQKLDEMKLSNKDIEKELDRNLEAFKQLEVEKKMLDVIEKLEELKNKEDALNKETENKKEDKNKSDEKKDDKSADNKKDDSKKPDAKELEKKQEEIAKQFEELKKDLKDLEQKNRELEEPNALPKTEEKQNEISKEMQKSSEQLNKNNKKEAAKSQKSASEKMEEMMEEMENSMKESEEKQSEENAQALRQILENLLNVSFAQEELIKLLPKTRIDNPQYVNIPKQQNKLKDDTKIIEDSLLALSKRAPQISAVVNREINAINLNMNKTVQALADRNTGEGTMRMQTTMTSVNNLALLLNEALEQMQKQMKQQQQQKGSSGKCKKPGSGKGSKPSDKPSMQSMKQLQEQLNEQLKQMKEAMEKGQKPGEKPGDKKGQKPGTGQNGSSGMMMPGSSEQLAKMAAQQEALRRQMQQMMDKLKNKGKNPGGDIADLMEQTEKDLVNKRLTNETMKRQQDILSKLLESEKAEREREQDEQRKSNEAKNQILSNPNQFLEYKRVKEKEMELLNTVPPSLTPYYKEKVNNYFNSVNK